MSEADSSADKGQEGASSSYPAVDDSGTDGEEDQGVTLVEVLEEQAKLEEDADAVLGGSDDKNCTYNLVCWYTQFKKKVELYLHHMLIGICQEAGFICLHYLHEELKWKKSASWCVLGMQLRLSQQS